MQILSGAFSKLSRTHQLREESQPYNRSAVVLNSQQSTDKPVCPLCSLCFPSRFLSWLHEPLSTLPSGFLLIDGFLYVSFKRAWSFPKGQPRELRYYNPWRGSSQRSIRRSSILKRPVYHWRLNITAVFVLNFVTLLLSKPYPHHQLHPASWQSITHRAAQKLMYLYPSTSFHSRILSLWRHIEKWMEK